MTLNMETDIISESAHRCPLMLKVPPSPSDRPVVNIAYIQMALQIIFVTRAVSIL